MTGFPLCAAATALLLVAALPALAQDSGRGVVTIQDGDTTYEFPIGLASRICGVDAGVIARHRTAEGAFEDCAFDPEVAARLTFPGFGPQDGGAEADGSGGGASGDHGEADDRP